MDNKKVEVVFEEEKGLKDRGKEETKKNTDTSERIMRDSFSRAGPRRAADDDDRVVQLAVLLPIHLLHHRP